MADGSPNGSLIGLWWDWDGVPNGIGDVSGSSHLISYLISHIHFLLWVLAPLLSSSVFLLSLRGPWLKGWSDNWTIGWLCLFFSFFSFTRHQSRVITLGPATRASTRDSTLRPYKTKMRLKLRLGLRWKGKGETAGTQVASACWLRTEWTERRIFHIISCCVRLLLYIHRYTTMYSWFRKLRCCCCVNTWKKKKKTITLEWRALFILKKKKRFTSVEKKWKKGRLLKLTVVDWVRKPIKMTQSCAFIETWVFRPQDFLHFPGCDRWPLTRDSIMKIWRFFHT